MERSYLINSLKRAVDIFSNGSFFDLGKTLKAFEQPYCEIGNRLMETDDLFLNCYVPDRYFRLIKREWGITAVCPQLLNRSGEVCFYIKTAINLALKHLQLTTPKEEFQYDTGRFLTFVRQYSSFLSCPIGTNEGRSVLNRMRIPFLADDDVSSMDFAFWVQKIPSEEAETVQIDIVNCDYVEEIEAAYSGSLPKETLTEVSDSCLSSLIGLIKREECKPQNEDIFTDEESLKEWLYTLESVIVYIRQQYTKGLKNLIADNNFRAPKLTQARSTKLKIGYKKVPEKTITLNQHLGNFHSFQLVKIFDFIDEVVRKYPEIRKELEGKERLVVFRKNTKSTLAADGDNIGYDFILSAFESILKANFQKYPMLVLTDHEGKLETSIATEFIFL